MPVFGLGAALNSSQRHWQRIGCKSGPEEGLLHGCLMIYDSPGADSLPMYITLRQAGLNSRVDPCHFTVINWASKVG